MRTFRRILGEVAQPISKDEIAFKALHTHELLEPDSRGKTEFQFKGNGKSHMRRHADKADVPEKETQANANFELVKGRNPPFAPYSALNKKMEIRTKIIDENSESHRLELLKKKKQNRPMTLEAFIALKTEPVIPAGGEYDHEKSHKKYKMGNKKLPTKFTTETFQFEDGTDVTIEEEDATLMNNLWDSLDEENQTAFEQRAFSNIEGFIEVLSFAKSL